ncbi:MAG: hypothetical protein EBR41_00765 [Crocinitomicaceae bacterium]|nr:hypothetical protein [Crocinitomicaceae bacterium]
MTSVLSKPVSAPGKSIIERLNFFTALALGVISAIVVWRLALQFLPQDGESARLFSREDKITLLSMTAWFIGFMTGIGALVGPFRWLMGKDLSHEENMFFAPALPLEDVFDPTGAGDTFAGGFMGYIAATDDFSFENMKRAIIAGSALASFCVEKFGTQRLLELTKEELNTRVKQFVTLGNFEMKEV